MNKPLVTIIIPCYNYADYVEEAILSTVNQTYKNIELIVINDGSTDNSDEVIKKLQEKHKFTYINQNNTGIVATRNKGVSLGNGEYLIQLDADDWIDSNYVEETLKLAADEKVDIVYTQATIFGRENFDTQHPDFNLEVLKHDGYISISALVKKNVFKNRKYDEYLGDKGNEDWDLYLDATLDGYKAKLLDKPLLKYRKHDHGKSRADVFQNSINEVYVRHHILSKQNAKHPDKMWYFSPYINLLKDSIDLYQTNNMHTETIKTLENRLKHIEGTFLYRTYKKIRSILH